MLASIKPELEKLNIGLVAIGSGNAFQAKSFQAEFGFPGELYVDEDRSVYKTMGCNRGLKYVLGKKAFMAIKSGIKEGFAQGKTAGDSLQLGGTFIMDSKGNILFAHMEEFAGDHVDLQQLLDACSKVKSQSN